VIRTAGLGRLLTTPAAAETSTESRIDSRLEDVASRCRAGTRRRAYAAIKLDSDDPTQLMHRSAKPIIAPCGGNTFGVKAVDQAGNSSEASKAASEFCGGR
jgi:hypothetical protein